MANVRGVGAGGPQEFYNSLPPVTRFIATSAFLTTLAAQFGVVSPATIALIWPAITSKYQVWRLVTNFFFIGKFSFHFLLQLIWIVTYGGALEKSVYQTNTADFIYMLIFGACSSLVLATIVPYFFSYFLGGPLIFMLLYVWSRNFPTQNVSIMGLFTVQAFYLPFCFLGISLAMGQNWMSDALGIIVGHLYYFLKVLHPAAGGARLLETPGILKRWVYQAGIGVVPIQQLNPNNPTNPTFRAFRGSGRRLAD